MINILKRRAFPDVIQQFSVLGLSSIMTLLLCSSTLTHASDIEIYKEARSGQVTLMFTLDISGSMTDDNSYDLPSGCNTREAINDNFNNTLLGVSYPRKYKPCQITTTTVTPVEKTVITKVYAYYSYRSGSTSSPTYQWYKCSSSGTSENKSDCDISITAPTTAVLNSFTAENSGNRGTYYFQNVTKIVIENVTTATSVKTVKYYRRLDRVRDAMYQLLYGANAMTDDRIIGLSVFPQDSNDNSTQRKAQILVPARLLNEQVQGVSQRQKLMQAIANIQGGTYTPTANAYAEVASYLFGTKTFATDTVNLQNARRYRLYNMQNTTWYQECNAFQNNDCSEWGAGQSTKPTNWPTTSSYSCTFDVNGNNRSGSCWNYSGSFANRLNLENSGFFESAVDTWNNDKTAYLRPASLMQNENQKLCSGQGIYLLTDGVPNRGDQAAVSMKNALGSHGSSFSCAASTEGWACMHEFVKNLLDASKNPLGLKVKTAIVGFGHDFNSVPSYSKNLSEAENIALINRSNANQNQKNAAILGVVGQGGWYSGSSVEDVINSVRDFVNNLSTEIPAVTTGTSTIPIDQLQPSALQNFAYYPQFQPTPDKHYKAWAGNLKKYFVDEYGVLRDKNNSNFVNSQGKILNNYDLWSASAIDDANQEDVGILGSEANRLMGGVKSRLKLRSWNGQVQRKVLTDRSETVTEGQYLDTATLRPLNLDLMSSADPTRGYLLSLLGYNVNAQAPETITAQNLNTTAELRQVGAIMHSSPVLLTNSGKVTFANHQLGSESREDYVLFGTTQGLLHVVDANTGEEKFAFVPNAMVENQKEAFSRVDTAIGPIDQFYYGVDGPWTAYTEYVNTATDLLTVGAGSNQQLGKQIVYGGLRMGGRNYYALDLHDMNNPQLKFSIKPHGVCSATNPLGCMGQSWSKPTLTWVNWRGVKKLVMLVGGGYDAEGLPASILNMPETTEAEKIAKQAKIKHYAGYEYDDYQQTNKIGAGVYMFDALDGNLLWWASANANSQSTTSTYVPSSGAASSYDANLKYSVVSQIRAIDRNGDGLTDHLYFGDLGGQVWRIDLNNQSTQPELFAKEPTRILNLNNGLTSPRFYDMPSFSTYSNHGEIFAVVAIGSGNRSQPLAEYSNTHHYKNDGVYSVYDKDVARSRLFELNQNQQYSMVGSALKTRNITLLNEDESVGTSAVNQLVDINQQRFSTTTLRAPYALTQGWYYLFKSNLVQSEKIIATPLVIHHDMFVTTFDASKDGLSGDCGAGVKGESFMTLFCMPYGQCQSGSTTTHRLNLGVGLVGGALGAGDSEGMTRLIVANVNTSGIAANEILNKRYTTANKLIPQRWYDRHY